MNLEMVQKRFLDQLIKEKALTQYHQIDLNFINQDNKEQKQKEKERQKQLKLQQDKTNDIEKIQKMLDILKDAKEKGEFGYNTLTKLLEHTNLSINYSSSETIKNKYGLYNKANNSINPDGIYFQCFGYLNAIITQLPEENIDTISKNLETNIDHLIAKLEYIIEKETTKTNLKLITQKIDNFYNSIKDHYNYVSMQKIISVLSSTEIDNIDFTKKEDRYYLGRILIIIGELSHQIREFSYDNDPNNNIFKALASLDHMRSLMVHDFGLKEAFIKGIKSNDDVNTIIKNLIREIKNFAHDFVKESTDQQDYSKLISQLNEFTNNLKGIQKKPKQQNDNNSQEHDKQYAKELSDLTKKLKEIKKYLPKIIEIFQKRILPFTIDDLEDVSKLTDRDKKDLSKYYFKAFSDLFTSYKTQKLSLAKDSLLKQQINLLYEKYIKYILFIKELHNNPLYNQLKDSNPELITYVTNYKKLPSSITKENSINKFKQFIDINRIREILNILISKFNKDKEKASIQKEYSELYNSFSTAMKNSNEFPAELTSETVEIFKKKTTTIKGCKQTIYKIR